MDHIIPLVVAACLCAAGGTGEPLVAAVRARSSGGGVYAERFARRYEPAVFVALPLHAPIPVLQLLSESPAPAAPAAPAPPRRDRAPPVYAASAPHAWLARPTAQTQGEAVAESHSYYTKTRHPLRYQTSSTWYGNKQQSDSSSWYGPSAADTTPAVYGQRLRPAPIRHASPAPSPAAPEPAWEEQAAHSAPQVAPGYREPPAEPQDNTPVILYASPTEQGGYRYRRRPAKPPKKAEPIIIRIHKRRIIRDD